MLSKLLNWKVFGAMILAGVISTGYYKLQYDAEQAKVERLTSEVSELKEDKKRLNATIKQIESDIVDQINKANRLEEVIADLQREKRDYIAELEKAKGRQELVWQYPLTVQRFFRSNWRDRTDSMSCAMGVLEKCSEQSQQD